MSRNQNSKKGRNGERKEPLMEKTNSIVEKSIMDEEDVGAFMDEKVVIKNKTDVVIENEGIKDIYKEWSVENTKELLQKITEQIPKRDNLQYEFRLNLIDWDKVKFKEYSANDCHKKWKDISKGIRSYRLMKEYLHEARALLKKSGSSSNNKEWKFPTKPIKPLTSFMLYYVLKKKSFTKANPTLKMIEVATLLGKKYNDLPKTKKDKFINFSKEMSEDYKIAMEKFYTAHPEAIPPKTSRNSSLKRKSATTPVKEDLPPNSSSEDSEDGSDFGKRRKTTKKKSENPPISAYSLRKQSVLNKNNVEHQDIPLEDRMLDNSKQRMVTSAEDKMQCEEEFQSVEQNNKTERASYLQSLPEDKQPDELKKTSSKIKVDVLAKNTPRKARNSSVKNEYSKLKNGENQVDKQQLILFYFLYTPFNSSSISLQWYSHLYSMLTG
uniref:HMG box domain-containing protein n=1 Tax=Clastoptera arizonana TaxID=38151 RepID=A0A1B6E9K1_9HEMI